ncbi:hypothetical protein ACFV3E_36790 [Streptomyces sp. NPDC059718]
MTTTFIAYLQFHRGGPTVTGSWDNHDTALRAYRSYVGLYGNPDPDSEVIIQLLEETDGHGKVLKRWTRDGEVDGPAEGPDESPV